MSFRLFEFDLSGALLQQVVKVLDEMTPGLLTAEAVRTIPEVQGVYQLHHDDKLVYVGKTDAEAGLRRRLERHRRRLQHRTGLDESRVRFKALQVLVFAAMDLETQLINYYKARGEDPIWNGSGFGSTDPAQARNDQQTARGIRHSLPT